MNEFKPEEGDRILVGNKRPLLSERTFVYINRHGRYMCVHIGDEKIYNGNKRGFFRVAPWLIAKPKLPEFIQDDPIIVWNEEAHESSECIRIVHKITEFGAICYCSGALEGPESQPWPNYKPLPNYDYGDRKVWRSEDKQ